MFHLVQKVNETQLLKHPIYISQGEELGKFVNGGSTVICLFDKKIQFDYDILSHSGKNLETYVMVRDTIGKIV